MNPITVAVPTYNGAAHIGPAIASVLAQEGVDFDLIVVDDRSGDGTLDVVRSIAGDRARIETNSEQLGLAGNWNRCARLCQTPLLSIFHQDDVMLAGHLRAHATGLESDDRLGLVASAVAMIDAQGRPIPPTVIEPGGLGAVDRVFRPGGLAATMITGNPLRCSAVSLRIDAHDDVQGFDPRYHYVVDWDFWLRLSRKWRVAWLAKPTVTVRWHEASETRRFKLGTDDLDETTVLMDELLRDDLGGERDHESLRQSARKRLARAYLNRAWEAHKDGRRDLVKTSLRKGFEQSPRILAMIASDPRLWPMALAAR